MFSLNDGLLLDQLDDPRLFAVIEGGRLVDLWTADNSFSVLGSVHLARVTGRFNKHKRLQGQLADGTAISWQDKDQTKHHEGQLALVTVTASARENKPIQAVAGIELAGQFVTLRWHGKATGLVNISRKLRSSTQLDWQREKITEACRGAGLIEPGFTLIIRRSAFTPDGLMSEVLCEAVIAEAAQIMEHWRRDGDMPADMRVETQARVVYAGLSVTDRLGKIENKQVVDLLTDKDWQMLCEQIEQVCRSEIITKDGAVLYIEQTRAAFMIDIDSSQSKLAPGPLSAAILPDLFAVIRLRRLAGKILVDMPALEKSQRTDILNQADELARRDLRFPDCLGFTRSGMLELSVRHGRPVLDKDDRVKAVLKRELR
tara:strand:+ start:627 stop:1745 length:1119 start_codon:yes stop_codon:yes gene_type:complete